MARPLWAIVKNCLLFHGELPGGARFAVSLRGLGDCDIGAGDRNRAAFVEKQQLLAAAPAFCRQIHGDRIYSLVEAADTEYPVEGYDGVWSAGPCTAGVFTADCLAIALVSEDGQRAVVHSGWRGTRGAIAIKALELMLQKGASPAGIRAVMGPSAGRCCYEVSEEFCDFFPSGTIERRDRRYFFDNQKAVVQQLDACGLSREFIFTNPYCTICDNDIFFSYRREGSATGRMFNLLTG